MTSASSVWQLVFTALVTFGAQLVVVSHRDVLILEWRPADLAAIALNYYRHGFHFLNPEILWGGSGPGYVEMEFPAIPYAIAVLYRLFGIHDWAALVIPILSGIGLPLVMNIFTRRLFGPVAGFVAGLFVAVSPTWLAMSTGLWPDAPPILCGSLGLYLLVRWVEEEGPVRFCLAAISIALAILLKLTSLYLGLPVAFVFYMKYRNTLWREGLVWLFALLVLLPPALWYIHAYRLFLHYHNTFGIIASGYMKFGSAALFADPRFYVKTFIRLVLFHATPLGAALVAIGIVRPAGRPLLYLFHVWLGAVLIYFLVAAQGVNLGHYQYALPIVPPCAALAGGGFVELCRRLAGASSFRTELARMVVVALIVLLTANAVAANYVFQSRGMDFRKLSAQKMKTGQALARLSVPGSLIVVVDADMDDRTPESSMTPPEVFYFSDRRGWYRAMSWLTPEAIENLRAQGARYVAVSANHVRWFRLHYGSLYHDCSRRYRTVMDNDDGIIYDLTVPSGPENPR